MILSVLILVQVLPVAFQPTADKVSQAMASGLADAAAYAQSTQSSPIAPAPISPHPWKASNAASYLKMDEFTDASSNQVVRIQLVTNCWWAYVYGLTRLQPGFFQRGVTTPADRNAVIGLFTVPASKLSVQLLSLGPGAYRVSLQNQHGKLSAVVDASLAQPVPPDVNDTPDTDLQLAELQRYQGQLLGAAAALGQPVGGIERCRVDFDLTLPDGSAFIQPGDSTLTVIVSDFAGHFEKQTVFHIDD